MNWNLNGTMASISASGWSMTIDLSHPQLGITVERENSSVFPKTESNRGTLRVFRTSWPGAELSPGFTDGYSRQHDLVASYAPNSLRDFQVQLDFKLLEANDSMIRTESWISTQTFLLECHPKVALEFQFPFSPMARWFHSEGQELKEAGCQVDAHRNSYAAGLFTSPHVAASVLILIYPADLGEMRWLAGNKRLASIQQEWFGATMEKGVIRRGRLRAVIFNRDITPETVAEEYALFQDSPLPLTT